MVESPYEGKNLEMDPPPQKKNPKQTQEFIRLTGILALRKILIPVITENDKGYKTYKDTKQPNWTWEHFYS